jgi:hypothetical protein
MPSTFATTASGTFGAVMRTAREAMAVETTASIPTRTGAATVTLLRPVVAYPPSTLAITGAAIRAVLYVIQLPRPLNSHSVGRKWGNHGPKTAAQRESRNVKRDIRNN